MNSTDVVTPGRGGAVSYGGRSATTAVPSLSLVHHPTDQPDRVQNLMAATAAAAVSPDNVSLFPLSLYPLDAPTNSTRSTNSTEPSFFDRDESLAKIEIALMGTIVFLALFGNVFVLAVLRMRRKKLSRMQWFIVHLSLADIFVALLHSLPQMIMDITNRFYGDDFLCRFVKYLTVVGMYASSYVLVMAAVDRYVSICHPLTNHTLSPKRVHLMILLAWSLSLLFALPQVFIFRLKDMGDGNECFGEFDPAWGLQAWVTWLFVSVYAGPFLLLAFCYLRICRVVWLSADSRRAGTWNRAAQDRGSPAENRGFLWKLSLSRPSSSSSTGATTNNNSNSNNSCLRQHSARGGSVNNGHILRGGGGKREEGEECGGGRSVVKGAGRGRGRGGMSKSKVKTVKLTLTVVLCYLLCWAPFFFVNMLTAWDESVLFEGKVFTIIALLASLNSCTNPWIYLAFSGRPCGGWGRGGEGRISRSWTRSTHVVTVSYDSECRGRSSLHDLSRPASREASPWARDAITSHSAC